VASSIRVTGPHPATAGDSVRYNAVCTACGASNYFELFYPDAIKGELAATIQALIDNEPLPEISNCEGFELRLVASRVARGWYREFPAWHCLHYPVPARF
jgi:hypothetical protein